MPSLTYTYLEELPVEAIKPYANNPRAHSRGQIKRLRAGMETFGFTTPVLIAEDGELIAGHGRLEAAKSLGLRTVRAMRIGGLSAGQKRALRIADNRLNDSGSVMVIVMQRLHVNDLCGHLLKGGEPWRQVALSAVARTDEAWPLANGVVHRRSRGEPLCAVRAGLPVLRDQLRRSGAVTFSAQYLQHPLDLAPTATHRVVCTFKALVPLPGHEHRTPPRKGMIRIPLEADIRAAYFSDPPFLDLTRFREMTSEEFQKETVEEQARMVAEMRADQERREGME